MCPAAGQGALAIESRSNDAHVKDLLAFLDDSDTRSAIQCERALLQSLGGGCQVPIGAYAEKRGGSWHLVAMVGRPDGSDLLREETDGNDPEQLGRDTAQKLLSRGANRILEDVYRREIAAPAQP
jgi:hydroxymethylbilane synthase